MSKRKHSSVPAGARVFNARILVLEEGPSLVETWEDDSPNVSSNLIPGGHIGLTEGLRMARKQIVDAYVNKQREFELRERRERVKANREQLAAERLKKRLEAVGNKEASHAS